MRTDYPENKAKTAHCDGIEHEIDRIAEKIVINKMLPDFIEWIFFHIGVIFYDAYAGYPLLCLS
jgi:hypothetical protein